MVDDSQHRSFAVEVVRALRDAGHVALWAGGCVRDLLMGREPQDFDVATSAAPEQVRAVFGRRRTLSVGESFGVVIVLGPKGSGLQVEVATFRTEGRYADGRRPESVRFATPEEDAGRRDFTINGMFYDPLAERVLDYVGGERDLQAGILRAIGDPRARMTEDKLRMLRAVRFAATLDFELDPVTAAAVRELSAEILVVSWERIAQELRKMLRHRHRRRAVRLTQQLGLLQRIVPELGPLIGERESPEWAHALDTLDLLGSPRFEAAAAVLLQALPPRPESRARHADDAGTVLGVCRRWRLSNAETDDIAWLVEHRRAFDGAEQLPLSRLKRLLAQPLAEEALLIAETECRARNHPDPQLSWVRAFLARTSPQELNPPPLATGSDLLALGIPSGPQIKAMLETVRDAQLEGTISTPDEALELARQLRRLSS